MTKGQYNTSFTRLKEQTERERERASCLICIIIKNVNKTFFINSDVLTEQHRLQARVHTSKCNPFNLITSYCPLVFSTTVLLDIKQRRRTYNTWLVDLQAGVLPYRDGYHSYHFVFIQQLRKISLIFIKQFE